jgi:transcriptional regulator with XRE-family HTH domain
MTDLERIGAAVRECREEKGLTLQSLASQTGYHYTYIGSIERGERNITLKTLLRLAGALSIPSSQILQRAEATSDSPLSDDK